MFNIFVGISLGNKLLTPEHAEKYVKYAHHNTKDDAVILIADRIDAINWQIFNDFSKEEALEKVKNKAYNISGMFDKAKRKLANKEDDPGYIAEVHNIFWEDIINPGYEDLYEKLVEKFEANKEFREKVMYFVDKYIELREESVSDDDRRRLADYILAELPTLLGGIYWNEKLYNMILYPTYVDSGMSEFVLDIRGGEYFDASDLELRQICVLAEDYLRKPDTEELSQ